ncbi:MAG: Hsp20/alpha crystallin family protein [Bacteroidetes bacterium]|nr:MAG: Hsp20/alpha crystallin family protein [Bacteroidota bacterium]TAG85965.1 MAG: Hsp20/alpha crystallin family protein [Bacteroidota bacterium]
MGHIKFQSHLPHFTNVLGNFFGNDGNAAHTYTHAPAVNVKENSNQFLIEVVAPGFKKEDFQIQLENNLLTISAEIKTEGETKNEDEKYTRKEFHLHNFKRSFNLPKSADTENINANYNNGILEISITKKEEAKPKPVREIAIV